MTTASKIITFASYLLLSMGCKSIDNSLYGIYEGFYDCLYFEINKKNARVSGIDMFMPYDVENLKVLSECRYTRDQNYFTLYSTSYTMNDVLKNAKVKAYKRSSDDKIHTITLKFTTTKRPGCYINIIRPDDQSVICSYLWNTYKPLTIELPEPLDDFTFSVSPSLFYSSFSNLPFTQYMGLLSVQYPKAIDCRNIGMIEIQLPTFDVDYFGHFYFYGETILIEDSILHWNNLKFHKLSEDDARELRRIIKENPKIWRKRRKL